MLNLKKILEFRLKNFLQTLIMLSGMAVITGAIGFLLFGKGGIVWTALFSVLLLFFSPQVPPYFVLQIQGAIPLSYRDFPLLFDMVEYLVKNSHLQVLPRLYYIPSMELNALSLGDEREPYIAVTDGLLRTLDERELFGVLAHEIAHIENGDLKVMRLGSILDSLVSFLSWVGFWAFIFALFSYRGSAAEILAVGLFLLYAPFFNRMLLMALSRAREFEADLRAAELTGDPESLASALKKIAYISERLSWWKMFPFGRREIPPWLKSHPDPEERIARLKEVKLRVRRRPRFYTDDHFEWFPPTEWGVRVRPRRRYWFF